MSLPEILAAGEVPVVFVAEGTQPPAVLILRVRRMTEMDDRTVRECSLVLFDLLRRFRKDDTVLLNGRHLFYRQKIPRLSCVERARVLVQWGCVE